MSFTASEIFERVSSIRFEDNSWWTGYDSCQYENGCFTMYLTGLGRQTDVSHIETRIYQQLGLAHRFTVKYDSRAKNVSVTFEMRDDASGSEMDFSKNQSKSCELIFFFLLIITLSTFTYIWFSWSWQHKVAGTVQLLNRFASLTK